MIFTDNDLVTRVNSIGIDVWCYGSDNEMDWREALALGVKGLIVDNPQEAVECFGRIDGDNSRRNAEQGAPGQPATAGESK